MSEVIHGTCLCGKVAFDLQEPEVMCACHCSRCQRWTGGSGSTVVVVASKDLRVVKGQESMKRYQEEGFADRCFCSHCGSSLYADGGEKLYVGAGVLRGLNLKPAFHMQVAHKASWDEIAGDAPQFSEWRRS